CKTCMVNVHKQLPLHFIECWNGKFFEPSSLKELGLRVQLGHKPCSRCPNPLASHHDFTVLHTNGVHHVGINFCSCPHASPHYIQLLCAMWFPATPINPQTAVTFSCLRQFQHFNCLGKLPAYEYYRGLDIMTTSCQRVPLKERYRVFLRTVLEWQHLKMCKRGGRGHAVSGIKGTAPGELALDCPACPHPEKNLPPMWKDVEATLA
ncbi:hypothetical protein K435DRAFT_683761, partial [Dendrothele bispora CBS 962.96]